MSEIVYKPDYLFEISWEVCNKVGGIHTVISTKAHTLVKEFHKNYIVIGPDVVREEGHENTEFIEDENILKSWKNQLKIEGLPVRIGRWNIPGKPIAVLINFTPFIPQKDVIFTKFWELYKLDSLTGQWDYIESTLFGYAAGKVIENFIRFNLTIRDKVVANFHEWMSGTGILYLKEHVPQVATTFTTHATVIGRCLAGNGFPLYDNLHEYDGNIKAKEFNVVAKQSLEKISAKTADCFTTVSEIAAKECIQFLEKNTDSITPNGFDESFVPVGEEYNSKKKLAVSKIKKVSEALLDCHITNNSFFIGISGRYEYRNKGIDLFINALGKLNSHHELKKDIIAFICLPADNYGPRKDLLKRIEEPGTLPLDDKILTHNLHYAESDIVLNQLKINKLENTPHDKVKVIFVPSYLNGDDGIFDISFYDMLLGMNLTIFPSYYEPWGYTPLESLAFHIPTITTSVAGFGLWVREHHKSIHDGISIIERTDKNDNQAIDAIVNIVLKHTAKTKEEAKEAYEEAKLISKSALWSNLIKHYLQAYSLSIERLMERVDTITELRKEEYIDEDVEHLRGKKPEWKKVYVESNIPESLMGLVELANNIWWSWNEDAVELFEVMDKELFIKSECNPVQILEEISYERLQELEKDGSFMARYAATMAKFKEYMNKSSSKPDEMIAYFSMEYGLHDALKIFSGGLGLLAGDYLKEASDCNINMIGIGLLYRFGYFKQTISVNGDQITEDRPQKFSQLPANPVRDEDGNIRTVSVTFPGRNVFARIWRVNVGRIPLYLLDTDHEGNLEQDRSITYQLYGGTAENRFKQEMILGVGGVRTLALLGIKPYIYHNNEGHAAFSGLERLRRLINMKNMTFDEALEIVRATSIFTTHTPVAAGHDAFNEDILRTYMSHYPERLRIKWEEFMSLGKINPYNKNEKFSMSYLAASLAQEINGVSWLHGEVTKTLFNSLWEGYYPEELHIGYVTNGVHYHTWTAKRWKELHKNEFGKNFLSDLSNKNHWNNIYKVPDERIWEIRQTQRSDLINYIKERYRIRGIKRHENPKRIVEVTQKISNNALTIGFARRFATYKRAHLLFKNLERLSKIINNSEKPVQFLYAGKAHPNDKAGQDLIKYIVQISQRPEFIGKIIFLENYDIALAKKLVQGVDIWLNTPTRPLEASGTSGMKAVLNGALHFSVLDGWWVEGYKHEAGWALPEKRTYTDQEFQDELDSELIYDLIEHQIVPLFYDRNKQGIPEGWVRYIKNSLANIAPEFTTKRMLDDYISRFYERLINNRNKIRANDYQLAYEIAKWKRNIYHAWEGIKIGSVDMLDPTKMTLKVGEKYVADVEVNLNGLSVDDIGLEFVAANISDDQVNIVKKAEFQIISCDENNAHYRIEISPNKSGVLNYGIRLYPKGIYMPHRQDMALIKWI